MQNNFVRTLIAVIVIVIIGGVAWGMLTMPDERTTSQRVGDAADALPQGVGKAERQLESRTPGQRIGDAVKDAGDTIKDKTTDQQ